MHHLKPDQLKALLGEVPQKHRLMLLVGFWHALRISELTGLTSRDIQGGYLNVQRLKGSLRTVQPWVISSDPELNEYDGLKALAKLPLDTVLFPITRFGAHKMMRRAGARIGLPTHLLHPHVLKHSMAMVLIKKKPINEVQVYLGHKSLASTGAYLRVTDEEASAGWEG